MGRLKTPPARLTPPPRAVGYSTRQEAERARDKQRRDKDGETLRKLYSRARWRKLRLEILARDGWRCQQTGVLLTGEVNAPNSPVVDHIEPHRGNLALFWDRDNLQAVSKAWHDKEKQRQERADLAQKG